MAIKKLSRSERHVQILGLLEKHEMLEVSWLAEYFSITEMSIRNDLNYLEEQKKLKRLHGRAALLDSHHIELPLREKELKNRQQKNDIGRAAASLVENGTSLFLDAGTTTEYVARNLKDHKDISIFTNGINIINTLLAYTNQRIYIIGGEICNRSYASVGEIAEENILKYLTKYSIFSADGFSLDKGITNNSSQANSVAKKFLLNSSIKILAADSGKLDVVCPFYFGDFTDIDILITDNQIPENAAHQIQSTGVRLIIAESIQNW